MSPGSFPAAERSTLGSALGSGVRGARAPTSTPPSGVRSAPEPSPPKSGYVPPRPAFDSEPQLTRVTAPDPSLLALTRAGQKEAAAAEKRRASRVRAAITWFALGAFAGGGAVWSVTSDVRADVYHARIWIADSLRALHTQEGGEAPGEAPILAIPTPAPASAATPLTPDPVPTVDVGQLPRAREGDAPSPPPGAPSPSPPPGAPSLKSAPGPH